MERGENLTASPDCGQSGRISRPSLELAQMKRHGGQAGRVESEVWGSRGQNFSRPSGLRPHRKNDNARVEQKNWTHVRQLVGYGRLGEPWQAEALNKVYSQEGSRFRNFFCPAPWRLHLCSRGKRRFMLRTGTSETTTTIVPPGFSRGAAHPHSQGLTPV